MAGNSKPTGKALQWRLECLGHSLLEGVASLLPGAWAFHIGESLGGLAWHLMPRRRQVVRRNLRIAFAGRKNHDEIERLGKASFRRSAANLFCAAHTAGVAPQHLSRVLEIGNPELMEQALSKGRGVVLQLSHMGNWELLSRLIHLLPPGTPLGGFYRPLNNELLNERVLARRQADGSRMFSKRDPFHQVCRFLRDGGVVGILADQRVGRQGELVSFFGRITRGSPLPSLLARRTKSEVLSLSLASTAPGRWKATYAEVESPTTTDHCMRAIEQSMEASPVDVFWLQDRWHCYLRPRHGFRKWLGEETPRSSKPHRCLLWLGDEDAAWQLPDHWQHPDVDYEVATSGDGPLPDWLPANTRRHSAPTGNDAKSIDQCLNAIDQSQPLPLDAVVGPRPPAALRKVCKRIGIPCHKV